MRHSRKRGNIEITDKNPWAFRDLWGAALVCRCGRKGGVAQCAMIHDTVLSGKKPVKDPTDVFRFDYDAKEMICMAQRTAYHACTNLRWGRRKRPPEDPQTRFVERSDGLFQVVREMFRDEPKSSVAEVTS
ncbi:hypothetical protein COS66_03280 [Candidatus Berkelbacteria bacterium CG06_land_8_20_14_3_00_43_10]|uniref:Uncharacterized protein n=1 Tax=Candidatus Berkelbacteria bacterium CG10_big_fil_rev_8_21_14_0_10_43_14 TaxID=1974515 RepID=A0A2M6R946_9BACT|nr:MAG: hypothetical protein AUK41_02515 [Candidatus Berkelbacteria bacterium CG2_30_43_20]PIS07144.1 MAG: hypothetical protein COT79_00765 [Candidatus Berkelbacteria bacterium CG10_big_fil_rev_8_21_14_0_10_43_14]PIU86974.1 MAG: hypothetical protein COS66_03280 [Candidatus Berkelbacteria bacterium CG06_land_8_20_14_3_00_43_10]